jgi:antitoxin VapB
MKRASFARLFGNGGSQAVRIPREFRFKGERVRVRRSTGGVLLLPLFAHAGEWLIELDAVRNQIDRTKAKSSGKEKASAGSRRK